MAPSTKGFLRRNVKQWAIIIELLPFNLIPAGKDLKTLVDRIHGQREYTIPLLLRNILVA